MEDAMTVKLGLSERHPNVCLAGVFDGHAGDRASSFLSANLANKISELSDPTDSAQLSAATLAIDADFLASCPTQDLKDHGSTCVFAVFYPIHDQGETDDSKKRWHVKVCNVGDSRAMILRQDGTCVSLTKDHKPQDDKEKERIEKCNGFVRDNRVDGQLAMSRAIGDWQYKRNLAFTVAEQKVIPVPDITEDTVCCGDLLFICCDGIVEHMSNEDACNVIEEEVKKFNDVKDIDPATIVPQVFKQSLVSGSKDNMSGILIYFGGQNFDANAESKKYIPGPLNPEDSRFVEKYKNDALKHGVHNWQELAATVPINPSDDFESQSPMAQFPPDIRALLARTGNGSIDPNFLFQLNSQLGEDENDDDMLN